MLNKIIFVIFFYCVLFSSFAEIPEISLYTGAAYYEITTDGGSRSEAYVADMMAKIQADWYFMKKFFIGASGTIPLLKENSVERILVDESAVQQNSFNFGEKSLELYGGYEIIELFSPFLGFSVSETSLSRDPRSYHSNTLSEDQTYNSYDFLMGFKGYYEVNDYTAFGYSMTYQTSPLADAETEQRNYRNIDSSRFYSSVSFKYWLPNELFQVGVHLYGGKTMYDRKSSADELLPETDIRFVGVLLSCKINI